MQYGPDSSVRKEPCPQCGKKNALLWFPDGSARCFTKGCGHHEGNYVAMDTSDVPATPHGLLKTDERSFQPLTLRNIAADTLRKMGYFTAGYDGARVQVAPLYDAEGLMSGQCLLLPDGSTKTLGEVSTDQWLYGRHAWGDNKDRKVVIASTPQSALAIAQATKLKVPSVSPLTGGATQSSAALLQIKSNYRWLDRFGEIVLFFDVGNEQFARDCASLFEAGKVKIAKLDSEFQSPADAQKALRSGDIDQAIWGAVTWRPTGIVNAKDGLQEFLAEGLQVPSWPFPWEEFNAKSLGMRPGEITYHVGGTGIAKTTLMFHYAVHLLKWNGRPFVNPTGRENYPVQPKTKVGWLGFEDLTKQVKVGLLSVYAGRRLHLDPVDNEQAAKLYTELFGDGGLELYDPEQAEYGLAAIKSYIRYMGMALDCKVIFIDPLSIIIAMLPGRDRTSAEEAVAAEFAAMAKQMGVSMHIGYHLRKSDGTPFEEGGEVSLEDIKGASALNQFSHNVFAYERDQQGSRPDLLRVRALKMRFTGQTGIVGILKYDSNTGRYEPTDEPWPTEEDSGGKGFTPVPSGGSGDTLSKDY